MKWRCETVFKNMVRAGKSGMIYDFFMYGLSTVLVAKNVEPKNLLAEQLPKNQNYRLFLAATFRLFHYWWIFIPWEYPRLQLSGQIELLDVHWRQKKIWKNQAKGSFYYHIDLNSLLHVLKWFNNKGVIVASTFSGVATSNTKQLWYFKKKEHWNVPYPKAIVW